MSVEPLIIEETTVGTGDIVGGYLLNLRFVQFIKDLLGPDGYAEMIREKPNGMEKALKEFEESVKREYCSDYGMNFTISLPGTPNNKKAGISSGHLELRPEQVEQIFQPIVEGVISLLAGQVNNIRGQGLPIAAILLVGGFGQCQYLREKIEAHFNPPQPASDLFVHDAPSSALKRDHESSEGTNYQPIEIRQPQNAWTAVVRGAVLRGLEGDTIRARRSRCNYGVESHERAEIQAPGSGRFKDRHEGVYYKKKVMQWFLKKGDPYNRDSTFTMDFEHTWGSKRLPSRNHRWVANLLYANADDKAPATFRGGPMRLVCRLQVDFNEVPHEHFQLREREDGKPYRLLQYQLVMRFGKNELEFALRVDGEEYGKMITGTFDQEI